MGKENRKIYTMGHRMNWLQKWLEMRNYDIKDERMDYLFIIYNTAKTYLVDEAARKKMMRDMLS